MLWPGQHDVMTAGGGPKARADPLFLRCLSNPSSHTEHACKISTRTATWPVYATMPSSAIYRDRFFFVACARSLKVDFSHRGPEVGFPGLPHRRPCLGSGKTMDTLGGLCFSPRPGPLFLKMKNNVKSGLENNLGGASFARRLG